MRLLPLVAAAGLLAGCREDEELNLPGYPETPVGIVVSGTENAPTAVVKGTYEAGTGALKLDGALTRTYRFALSTPSPEDATFHVEKIVSNIPEERVTISATELHVPAGAISADVTVEMTGEDLSFMEEERAARTYELGVRLTAVEGSRVTMPQSEAKVIVEKEAYVMQATIEPVGEAVTLFKRSCLDGEIINDEPIAVEFRVKLDKPALRDLTLVPATTGTPDGYKACESFSGNVTIAAGKLESEPVTWSLTDDFLEGNDDPATYEIALGVEAGDAEDVRMADGGTYGVTVTKVFDYLTFLSTLDASWRKYDPATWKTSPSSVRDAVFDNDIYSYYYGAPFEIDMQETKSISGFRIVGGRGLLTYLPQIFEISTSVDGDVWVSQGQLRRNDSLTSGAPIIGLYRPVEARYIKFEMVQGYYSYVAEFEVYGK